MRLTLKQLHDVFYSGPFAFKGDPVLTQKIYFLLTHKYLDCRKITIAEKSKYYTICDDTEIIAASYEAAGGDTGHIALKLLAQNYLNSIGINVTFEKQFCGYFPDVISDDHQTIVECGHTDNADKIFTYFTQGNITELIQIPYPSEDDKAVFGYIFIAKPGLTGFLAAEFGIEKNKILSIMNRHSDK